MGSPSGKPSGRFVVFIDDPGGPGTDDDRQSSPAALASQSRPNLDEASSPELPGSVDGPYATMEERDQLLQDPLLKKVIRNSVRGRVPILEDEDVLQETLAAAHRAPSLPAGAGPDRNAYVVAIARKKALDNRRSASRFPQLGEETSVEDHVVQAVPAADMVGRDLLAKVTGDLRGDQTLTFRCEGIARPGPRALDRTGSEPIGSGPRRLLTTLAGPRGTGNAAASA